MGRAEKVPSDVASLVILGDFDKLLMSKVGANLEKKRKTEKEKENKKKLVPT